ncbi:MAG: murein L,D-transpeptidase catalytic domain family protein [Coxiellaceae bacterium]|nr:MAG: murein L,D-transpeptidase catalytic domain family protein [Coxiellaceae bacterium]
MKHLKLVLTIVGLACLPLLGAGKVPGYCQIPETAPVLLDKAPNLNPNVVRLALKAYDCALLLGYKNPKQILTIIDYSLPSTQKRMWVVNVQTKQVLYNVLVAQGKFTGAFIAKYFSNKPQSKQSSIGLFQTNGTYQGHNGLSLRLIGLDVGFNDKAASRDIVIHGAWYVSDDFVKRFGRLGTSWGCPAVSKTVVGPLINTIKDGTFVFSYYPNPTWLSQSKFLNCALPN